MTTRRRPGRPREPVPREQLLAAGIRVFTRDGFGAAHLAEVAREAGISKGALAYHFPSKESLYVAVMTDLTTAFGELVGTALVGDAPWPARLDLLGDTVGRVLAAQPQLATLMLRELADDGPFVAGPGRDRVAGLTAAIVRFLQEGHASGHVVEQDLHHLAGTIVLTHLGWFATPSLGRLLLGEDPTSAAAIERRVRAVTAQIRRMCAGP